MMLVIIVGDNEDGSVEVSTGSIEGEGYDTESPALLVFREMEKRARDLGAGVSELPQ